MRIRGHRGHRTRPALGVMLLAGCAAAAATGLSGSWLFAPAAGWSAAALVYNLWVWLAIAPLDAASTSVDAGREDPRKALTTEFLILAATTGSLGPLVTLMLEPHNSGTRFLLAALALGTTALSWLMVHLLFTLHYAQIYYSGNEPGGIDFNQKEPPQYTDFAYLAFSLGMTYQVPDLRIQGSRMRSAVLRHSLLSFVFGTGILAATINLVVSLAQ